MTPEQQVNEMQQVMRDKPAFRILIALHEAGHIVYGLRCVRNADIEYHGPHECPGRPGVFGLAGVRLNFHGAPKNILEYARYCAAGNVVKRVLAPTFWTDDDGADYEMFVEECQRGKPLSVEVIRGIYEMAKRDIERDLRNPAFRRELWDKAREVENKIPWGF